MAAPAVAARRKRQLTGLDAWDPGAYVSSEAAPTTSTPRSRQEAKSGHLPDLCEVAEPSAKSKPTLGVTAVEEGEPGAPVPGPTGHRKEDVAHLLDELETLPLEGLKSRAVEAGVTYVELAELEALQKELEGLDIEALKTKCAELGMPVETIAMAANTSTPNEALVAVYLRYYLILVLVKVLRL
eukprot:COSAG02_NODE_30510_length_549_cov_1.486667_1_plen_183_part_11